MKGERGEQTENSYIRKNLRLTTLGRPLSLRKASLAGKSADWALAWDFDERKTGFEPATLTLAR